MAKWKLARQTFGKEVFTFSEGDEVTVGRGANNTITLSSIVISRNHCVINVQKNQVMITDLKSSNGIYVGLKRIPNNTPYILKDSDVIGLGWTIGAPLVNINDNEKYVFKLMRDNCETLINRIKYQSDNDFDDFKEQANNAQLSFEKRQSPVSCKTQATLKRKADENFNIHNIKKEIKEEKKNSRIITIDDDVIHILSDSDNDGGINEIEANAKKPKLEPIDEEPQIAIAEQLKTENEYLQYEAFNVKQEYLGYDDEPIQINSDSDSESEHWLLRLSQNSPGKPFIKAVQDNKIDLQQEDSSYSQMDDLVGSNSFRDNENNEEEFLDDIISIPPHPPGQQIQVEQEKIVSRTLCDKVPEINIEPDDFEEFTDDIITLKKPDELEQPEDEIDGFRSEHSVNQVRISPMTVALESRNETTKKIQIIEPYSRVPKGKSNRVIAEIKPRSSSSKHGKARKHSSSKRHISNSEREERKKKLKEIAEKEKNCANSTNNNSPIISSKSSTNIKVTTSNRGAFLTDVVQVVKSNKNKDQIQVPQPNTVKGDESPNISGELKDHKRSENIENKKKQMASITEDHKKSKHKDKHDRRKIMSKQNNSHESSKTNAIESRVPLKSLKPLTDRQDLGVGDKTISGKPCSKVEPLPPKKPKKKVSFSEAGPQVHVFEIEPGNKMTKTSMVKTSLVHIRQTPIFSLEKITLMKILRWNPHWLEEQINNNDPPPILGHNSPPMTIFHSFVNHNQYVQLVGDLLLMEIWECLTLAYMKTRHQSNQLEMRIESLPPAPSPDRCFEFNISVNMTLPTSEVRNVPRVGEIILITFGPENARNQRFFFVQNVRSLPSPPSNKNSFFSISLHATFTEKMKSLRRGEVITGTTLAYINKELMLFEAMEYLAGSPLSEVILKPEPQHFPRIELNPLNIKSQWTATLNASQQAAVNASVSAALSDRPCIQMVQGPPGTGKSSVICAIVMTYFYDEFDKRHLNRGKILICATSNAAVDELVIRLLKIRQRLHKSERFRMVRVGRAEAMHPRAYDVSSQQLAQRDASRALDAPAHHPGLEEEIFHLQAKINMWKTAAQDAKDPVRVAYCQTRITELLKRIALVQSGGGGGGGCAAELRASQLTQTERRIVEGADIVVTTLASAHNHKMRGLKRRIALCIIDEAGQAIEPEALIPLTLDVTRLTLIGDPQQLPGYICSQRAKKHGLGESLFTRLSSCTEQWPRGSPVVLLNQQYRMHPDIADYPNRAFYDSKIQTVALSRPPLNVPPYSIISIASGDKGQSLCGANEMEAWGVARLVTALNAAARSLNLSLAVITPYNAHKELIKKYLRMLQDPGEGGVDVNTVDSFQGQERDVVVVSLARSQGVGFLTDAGRMNVMLTRAKHALLICLNPFAMLKNHQWRTLIEDAQRRNMYQTLPTKMCQPASAGRAPTEDILKYLQPH